MNVEDLVFKKEDEVIYTDEKTGLAFHLPNNKMVTIYINKESTGVELFQTPKKIGMVKLKNNMSMNKGDMKKVVKRINTDYGLDKKIIEDAFEVCEERLLLRPEPTMQGEDFKTKLLNKPDDKRALNELGQAMKQTKIMPKMLLFMVSTGEQSGRLGDMLEKAVNFLDKTLDGIIDTMTKMIEPIMLIVIGSIVLVMALALYLPLFQSYMS